MRPRIVAVPIAAVLVLTACGGGDDAATDDSAPSTDAAATTDARADTEAPVATDEPPATEAPDSVAPESSAPATDAPADTVAGACADSVGSDADITFDDADCDSPHNAEFAGTVPAPFSVAPTLAVDYDIALSTACFGVVGDLVGDVPPGAHDPLGGLGLEIAYDTEAGLGEPFDGEIGCWLRSPAIDSMTGSLREGSSLDAVLGRYVTLGSVPVGECFLPAPEDTGSIGVGTIESCDTVGVDQILTSITLDDGPWPGQDELFDIGEAQCPPLDSYTDVEPIGDTIGVIVMFATEWVVLGARDLLCTSYRAADFGAAPDVDPASTPCRLDDPEGDADLYDDPVPCDELHTAELAGTVAAPFDVVPEDPAEAADLARRACRDVVEALVGRSVARPGIGVGISIDAGPGEPVESDIECYADGRGVDLLTGSLQDETLEEAYGDAVILADLAPGTCFTFADATNDVGFVADCDESGALMTIGVFEADGADGGEYPGLDALRAVRNERCAEILADAGFAVDPSTISGTITSEDVWESFGGRVVTCDGEPL